jgi:RNA recognition motif-containing protein
VADREHPEQNRGFGFLTFYNHAAADAARKRLESNYHVGMRPVNVSWAELKNKVRGTGGMGPG